MSGAGVEASEGKRGSKNMDENRGTSPAGPHGFWPSPTMASPLGETSAPHLGVKYVAGPDAGGADGGSEEGGTNAGPAAHSVPGGKSASNDHELPQHQPLLFDISKNTTTVSFLCSPPQVIMPHVM